MGITIFRVCLIITNAFCIAMTDSKVAKVLGVVAITLMSISLLGR
jgi:hypothetical protein